MQTMKWRNARSRIHLWALLATLVACVSGFAILAFAQSSFTDYEDIRQVLTFLKDTVPAELRFPDELGQAKAWPEWVVQHDHDIRSRLQRGDDDTVVNWLLFGTLFTRQPRALLEGAPTGEALSQIISRRTADLISVLAAADPDERNADERNVFVRRLLQSEGYRFDVGEERARVARHLQSEVDRVIAERRQYTRQLEVVLRSNDVAEKLTGEAQLFRDRGLSLDTSIMPGFAIEQALAAMRNESLIAETSVRRVAIIGPGLDFADKNSGYDFYPVQTLQPFTSIDSLVRLGLAAPDDIQVTTLDISPRVNDHIRAIRARTGVPYVLRLPMEMGMPWAPDLVRYWKTMGDRVGSETELPKPPLIGKQLEQRGIEVRPQFVSRVTPVDFNMVTQKWMGPPFDLVIATNVLVYYDRLDQALAFASIEAMLRPGGFFVTNNPIVELPASHLRAVGGITVDYTIAPQSADHFFWYRRNAQ
jgi:hypothetical protein